MLWSLWRPLSEQVYCASPGTFTRCLAFFQPCEEYTEQVLSSMCHCRACAMSVCGHCGLLPCVTHQQVQRPRQRFWTTIFCETAYIYIYIHIWSYIYKGTITKTRFCRGSASMSWPIFLDNSTRISEGEGGQGFKTLNCLIGALLGFYKGLPLLDLLAGETT